MQALNTAWNALTTEQQAEYGTKEELHNACMEMIEKLKDQGVPIPTCQNPTCNCKSSNYQSTCQSISQVSKRGRYAALLNPTAPHFSMAHALISKYGSPVFENIAIRQKINHYDPETDNLLFAISEEIRSISSWNPNPQQ